MAEGGVPTAAVAALPPPYSASSFPVASPPPYTAKDTTTLPPQVSRPPLTTAFTSPDGFSVEQQINQRVNAALDNMV